jgi:hypothetical protein
MSVVKLTEQILDAKLDSIDDDSALDLIASIIKYTASKQITHDDRHRLLERLCFKCMSDDMKKQIKNLISTYHSDVLSIHLSHLVQTRQDRPISSSMPSRTKSAPILIPISRSYKDEIPAPPKMSRKFSQYFVSDNDSLDH